MRYSKYVRWVIALGTIVVFVSCSGFSAAAAKDQTGTPSQPSAYEPEQSANSSRQIVACRVMEVFVVERLGTNTVIFHQRDKADGPKLGELLKMHSGAEIEFQRRDGKWHRATIVRMKSCFGRGLLFFAAAEAKLAENDDFVLRFPEKS